MSRLDIEFRLGIGISKSNNAVATLRITSSHTLMKRGFFCACTAHGAWRVRVERGRFAHVERQEMVW